MSSIEKVISTPEATQILKVVVAFQKTSPKQITDLTGYNTTKVKDYLAQLLKAEIIKKTTDGNNYVLTESSLAQKLSLGLEEELIREAGEELTMVLFDVNMAKDDYALLSAIKHLNNFLEGLYAPVVKLNFQDIVFDLADKLEKQIMG